MFIHTLYIDIANVVNTMRIWMQNNPRRNSTREIKLNMTGHMSEIIIKRIPLCIREAAKILHLHFLAQIKHYIEDVILQEGDVITWIESHVHWGQSESSNHSNNFNKNDSSNDNNVISDDFVIDEEKDVILENRYDFYANIDDDDIVASDDNSDIDRINAINASNLNATENISLPEMNTIVYDYYYKINNTNTVYVFNNDDNVANVNYSHMLNLAVYFDWQSLWRRILCNFCTMQWPKNKSNETPRDIINCHTWCRSAVYKGKIFGNWLLYPYAKWAGGIGSYMLEAFWHYNPKGHGFYIINQQMAEHWGKWMKDNRRTCGTANGNNFLFELGDNYDIYVMGRILHDFVDLKKVVKNEILKSAVSFDLSTISAFEQEILNDTPNFFQMLRVLIGQMNVGDPIPDILQNIQKQDKNKWSTIGDSLRKHIEDIMQQNHNDTNNNQL